MPPTSATRPARFRTTMRRVRLEKVSTPSERSARPSLRRSGRMRRAWVAEAASAGISSPAPMSGFLEAISDAIEGFDHLELVVDLLELLSQPLDVAVDRPVVDIHLIVIGRIHQGIA